MFYYLLGALWLATGGLVIYNLYLSHKKKKKKEEQYHDRKENE